METPYIPGEWASTFPAEIIICDAQGTILEMNATAQALYRDSGGARMIGHNVFDHHTPPARAQVEAVVARRQTVMYTAEQGGQTRLVCIAPWERAGGYAGFALLVLDLPAGMAHLRKD